MNILSDGNKKILLSLFFIAAGLAVGRYIVPATPLAPLTFISEENGQRQLLFPTFWETWDKLHENFNGQLDDKKLYYGAVAGMVQAAHDPYTTFQDPEETKRFDETLSGSFSGIGVEIGVRNNLVTVIAPLADSPAQKAGLRSEDIIIAIDKTPITADSSIDDVVQRIRGPQGRSVTLTIVHKGDQSPTDITVVRQTISVESVKLDIAHDIAHVTITSFNGDTASRFKEAARKMAAAHIRGIVLDVRDDPGGYLQAAVDIVSQFVDSGSLVVTEKGQENREYRTTIGQGLLKNIPVVVLINKGSASASEIVAGALLDTKQAPVVGVKSFGKGSVQQLLHLKDGSSLKVTIAKWYTPSGHSIHEQGIEPTVVVEADKDPAKDVQLERAQEELKKLIH